MNQFVERNPTLRAERAKLYPAEHGLASGCGSIPTVGNASTPRRNPVHFENPLRKVAQPDTSTLHGSRRNRIPRGKCVKQQGGLGIWLMRILTEHASPLPRAWLASEQPKHVTCNVF